MEKNPTELPNRISCEAGASKPLTMKNNVGSLLHQCQQIICRFPTRDSSTFLSYSWETAAAISRGPVQFIRVGFVTGGLYTWREQAWNRLATFHRENAMTCFDSTTQELLLSTYKSFSFTLLEILLSASTVIPFYRLFLKIFAWMSNSFFI